MNHTIIVGTDLNSRKITCSIPDTTEITELKYIAKVTDDKYIAENKMTVEGQTGECSVGYYHYNDTINIFYLRNSSGVVTNLSNFTLPDDFGTVTEIDDTAVLYNYLTRDCHEKVYVICEDFCKEESMNKSQILTAIEDEAAEQAKSYGVPNGSIFNFDGDTIPGGFEEVDNSLVFENTDAVLTNVVSRNLFNKNKKIVPNANIDANGSISSNDSTFYQAKYISVKPNTKYTVSSANNAIYRIAEYDNSKTFIKRTYNANASTKYTIVTSSTTKFIRLAIDNSANIDTVMFAEADDTDYTPYLNLQELQENSNTISINPSNVFNSTKITPVENNKNEVVLIGNLVVINFTGIIKSAITANTFFDIGNMLNLPIMTTKNIIFKVLNTTKMAIGHGYCQVTTGNIRIKFATNASINDEINITTVYTLS